VFWIHNTGPIGCLSFNYYTYGKKKGNLDANDCVKSQNKIAKEFNKKLKDLVSQLRKELLQAKFTYVDMYKAKHELIRNARSQGDFQVFKRTHHSVECNVFIIIKLGMRVVCSDNFVTHNCMQPTTLMIGLKIGRLKF